MSSVMAGGGRDPTASAILSDVVDAARNLVFHAARRAPGFVNYNLHGKVKTLGRPMSGIICA